MRKQFITGRPNSLKINLIKICLPFILLAFFLSACNTTAESSDIVDLKEHFMVNDILYWQSSFPSETMPDTFQYVGTIQEAVEKTPTSNWESYSLPVGSKIYLDSDIPYQAWIDGKYRYRTIDAGRQYIMHDSELFVYLGSTNTLNTQYYQNYRNKWDYHIALKDLSPNTVYLGKTIFEGYDTFPVQELGSNCFSTPQDVYSYSDDANILLVSSGNDAAVYIRLQCVE